MPEGDTVRRTAGRLDQAFAGQALRRTELRWPSLGHLDLTGMTVREVRAYGKHLLCRMTGGDEPLTLHSHLRMDGSWRLWRSGSRPWPAADDFSVRAVLEADEWTAAGVLLGELDLLPTANEDQLLGHLGPDILAADFADPSSPWGVTEALRRVRDDPGATIGAALLDQRNLAGVGTFYLCEALFVQGISPWTPMSEVTDEVPKVVERARRMMTANLPRATPTTTGDLRNGNRQWVHARSGMACRRCATPIRVASLEVHQRSAGQTAGLDRTVFYCPHCQPGPTPTDDGRPQKPLGTTIRRSAYRRS